MKKFTESTSKERKELISKIVKTTAETIFEMGVDVYKKYCKEQIVKMAKFAWNADLEGANLKGADLEGANLEEANLEGANLREAKLWNANLKEASLNRAKLQNVDLLDADLQNADLRDAHLKNKTIQGDKIVWLAQNKKEESVEESKEGIENEQTNKEN